MSLLGKRYPDNEDDFVVSRLPGEFDENRAGKRMRLPVPETWETVISAKGNDARVWESLIDHQKLPFMATLRNLRNLLLAGISAKHHDGIISRLRNERSVANSRQFPSAFLSAYAALREQMEETPAVPARPARGRKAPKPVVSLANNEYAPKYLAALEEAINISARTNIKPIRGRTVLLCNVGDEMMQRCSSARRLGKPMQLVEVAFLLGLMCKYSCEDCELVFYKTGFATTVQVDLSVGILANIEILKGQIGDLVAGQGYGHFILILSSNTIDQSAADGAPPGLSFEASAH